MEIVTKVFYFKPDNTVKVHRFSMEPPGAETERVFEKFQQKVEESFPGLKGKVYFLMYEDKEDDLALITSDETVKEAFSKVSEGSVFRLYVRQERGAEENKKAKEKRKPEKESEQKISAEASTDGSEKAEEKNAKKGKSKADWKTNLRQTVPDTQRRWAKAFIQEWRSTNIARNEVSSTSSDDSDDQEQKKKRMQAKLQDLKEQAEIPDSFQKWLQAFLPRWHKRWGKEKPKADLNVKDTIPNAEFEEVKASTPDPFRKWVRWYLTRHFAADKSINAIDQVEKDENKSAQDDDSESSQGEDTNPSTAVATAGVKGETLKRKEPVSLNKRAWAKKYIRDWRKQHHIETKTTSDSKKEDEPIHEDYSKWMKAFLVSWHQQSGQADGQNSDQSKDEMEQFKDTVPEEFRSWVRDYINRRYKQPPKASETNSDTKNTPATDIDTSGQTKDQDKTNETKSPEKKNWESVSSNIRMWAKKFIQDWRAENGVVPESASKQDEDSSGDKTIPDDYSKWMDGFLVQWHLQNQQTSGQELQKPAEGLGKFKDTVDEDFRRWARHYVNRTYGSLNQSNQTGHDDEKEKLNEKLKQMEDLADDVMASWREMNEWQEEGESSTDEDLGQEPKATETNSPDSVKSVKVKGKKRNPNVELERDVRKRLNEIIGQITM